jgi:hypothetical protein
MKADIKLIINSMEIVENEKGELEVDITWLKSAEFLRKPSFVTLTKKEATLFATYALQLVGEMKDMKEKKGKSSDR